MSGQGIRDVPRGAHRPGLVDGRVRRGRTVLLSLAVLLVALGGCSGSGGTAAETSSLRTDVEWQLVSFQSSGGPVEPVPDSTRYTVRFGADGSVSARVDCNRCAGRYQVAGPSLTIGQVLACTRAACPLPSLDDRYTAALTSVSSYVQTETELDLLYDGGTLHFRAPQ